MQPVSGIFGVDFMIRDQVFQSITPVGVQKLADAGSNRKWDRNVHRDVMRQLGSPAAGFAHDYLLHALCVVNPACVSGFLSPGSHPLGSLSASGRRRQ